MKYHIGDLIEYRNSLDFFKTYDIGVICEEKFNYQIGFYEYKVFWTSYGFSQHWSSLKELCFNLLVSNLESS